MAKVLQILQTAQVDFGSGEMAGIGGSQPSEGLHEFEVTVGHLTASQKGNAQVYHKAAVVASLLGEPSIGKSNQDWQSLPNSKQEAGKKATTQGLINRMLFSMLGTTLSGVTNLTDAWINQALTGRRYFGYYFPFVAAQDNEGTELGSATVYLSRAAVQPDGSVIDEVALVQGGQKTINRPRSTVKKAAGGAPGYQQALTQVAAGTVPVLGIPGIPGMPGMPPVPGAAVPGVQVPGVGAGFVPQATAPVVAAPVAAAPANGVGAPVAAQPMPQIAGLPPILA